MSSQVKKPYSAGLFIGVFSLLTIILTLGQVITDGKNGEIIWAMVLMGISFMMTIYGVFRSFREIGSAKGAWLGLIFNLCLLLLYFFSLSLFTNS